MNFLNNLFRSIGRLFNETNLSASVEDHQTTETTDFKPPFSEIVSFNRRHKHIYYDFDVKIGDEVSIWLMPNTNRVNLYANGSAAGRGLFGTIISPKISSYLQEPEYLFVNAKVLELNDFTVNLLVELYYDKNKYVQIRESHKQKWFDLLNKKYNPKNQWSLRFYSQSITLNGDIKINYST